MNPLCLFIVKQKETIHSQDCKIPGIQLLLSRLSNSGSHISKSQVKGNKRIKNRKNKSKGQNQVRLNPIQCEYPFNPEKE